MSGHSNRFSLFGRPQPQTHLSAPHTLDDYLRFVRRTHQRLLIETKDPLLKARLYRSHQRVTPSTPENYLLTFIKDFENEPTFASTVAEFRKQLTALRQAKRNAAVQTLKPKPTTSESLKLSQEQKAWLELQETLKRCINNKATRKALAWHPKHLEQYYLAKFYLQWQQYEMQYGPINVPSLNQTLADEIAQEREQTIIENHVEAKQALIQENQENRMNPTQFNRENAKLEKAKSNDLNEVEELKPQLVAFADEVIAFAQQPTESVENVFNAAIEEVTRQEFSMKGNPALFKMATGSQHKPHAMATLKKFDQTREMMAYRTQFIAALASKDENLHDNSSIAPVA